MTITRLPTIKSQGRAGGAAPCCCCMRCLNFFSSSGMLSSSFCRCCTREGEGETQANKMPLDAACTTHGGSIRRFARLPQRHGKLAFLCFRLGCLIKKVSKRVEHTMAQRQPYVPSF